MEYLKSICVADINDRIRISSLINDSGAFVMPSIVVLAQDFETELFQADNNDWIKDVLLPQLIEKSYRCEDVLEFRKIIKKEGIKRKEVINLIQEAIKMKMI